MPNARILFVDDESRILDAVRRGMRGMAGEWDMDFAHDGLDALQVMQRNPADVVVTDMAMPAMDGETLIHHLTALYPDRGIVVLSGHWTHDQAHQRLGNLVRFLSKPTSIEMLIASIRETLSDVRLAQALTGAGSGRTNPRPAVEYLVTGSAADLPQGWVSAADDY